jgi:glycerol-3-phosphate dehydrogenase|tara:strand:+ start:1549 stop:2772 length:1224 start_codon:yes stop_codon:yes gene_type:complete
LADYDVIVIGGGINGVGVAQAAAAANHSVLLLEKQALASGTSSKSSKLIHGGLRYLESWEMGLVREALLERALLLRLAPDLVKLRDFNLPVYAGMRRGPALLYAGLSFYYGLSGFDKSARFSTVARKHWGGLDGLRTDGLKKVFRYHDAQTDDVALTKAVMQSAIDLGAELICPARVTRIDLSATGCEIVFHDGKAEKTVTAKVCVNAAGPWANSVLDHVSPAVPQQQIELIQGTHIMVPGKIKQGCYYVESRRDGRAVFVLPWQGQLMVGTTETRYKGRADDVQALRSERQYLCSVLQYYFPEYAGLSGADSSVSDFAGLRVLPGGDSHVFHRSRETVLHPDRPIAAGAPRLLSIYGGKLTAYRITAAKVMQHLQSALPERRACARTDELPLSPVDDAPIGCALLP